MFALIIQVIAFKIDIKHKINKKLQQKRVIVVYKLEQVKIFLIIKALLWTSQSTKVKKNTILLSYLFI